MNAPLHDPQHDVAWEQFLHRLECERAGLGTARPSPRMAEYLERKELEEWASLSRDEQIRRMSPGEYWAYLAVVLAMIAVLTIVGGA